MHVRKALRRIWRADVKRWCEVQDRIVEWGYDSKEAAELAERFNALDVDRSGTVEEDELRGLMDAMGVEVRLGQIERMFASIGKPVDEIIPTSASPPLDPIRLFLVLFT